MFTAAGDTARRTLAINPTHADVTGTLGTAVAYGQWKMRT